MNDAAPIDPIKLATAEQRRAADPAVSAWVSASAGSGKTQVLRDRVLRLLLEGAAPERILCLTFTKAGAAEMANRIATTLAEWAAIPDAELKSALTRLLGNAGLARYMVVARGLFARVLDAPGGMRIETIHAFCQSLLRRFPLEARVAPHFRLIEERDAAALLNQAREAQFEAARASGDADLAAALAHLVAGSGEMRLDKTVTALLADRARFAGFMQRMADLPAYRRALAGLLGIDPALDRDAFLERQLADAACDATSLRQAMQALMQGSDSDAERARILAEFLAADIAGRVARFDAYFSLFITQKGAVKDDKFLATAKAAKAMPGIKEVMKSEGQRLLGVAAQLNAIGILADSVALVTLGSDLYRRFQQLKAVTAALDFDDLILAARDLLRRPGVAPWVLYKLDGGIDHVLIDEGQDTSPVQWEIIKALTDELIAGSGAERSADGVAPMARSIFAVGDFKQSIFSFQGAEPQAFLAARAHFRERLRPADDKRDTRTRFEDVPLIVSFRSSPAVLQLVDRVFAGPAGAGVIAPGTQGRHIPARAGAAGLVELWPRAVPLAASQPEPWAAPSIDADPGDPATRVAHAIADHVAEMLRRGEMLPSQDRPVAPGDIMVLVRSRTGFVPTLVKALKAREVPVSGIDRLALLSELAVRDLVAMIDFLLLPEDDLNLASLLKSPLVGLGEDDLFALCVARGESSLWCRLETAAARDARFAAARDFLTGYLVRAETLTPYGLLADLLSAGGGRRRLFQRLGLQVGEAIDELLNLALAFEANNHPALQGFRQWLEAGEAVVKRELTEDGGGQVRIMTVHGAKGLQAPIVFLADAQRQRPAHSGVFWLGAADAGLPAWVQRKELDVAATAAARAAIDQRAQEEENRLLYVALTRAEDRLYVCGWRGLRGGSNPCWHDHVAAALGALPGVETAPADSWRPEAGWEGAFHRFANPQQDPPKMAGTKAGLALDLVTPLAPWAHAPAAAEPDPPRPLIPTRPSAALEAVLGAEPPVISPLDNAADGGRFQRGILIHKLFQMLPDIDPAIRRGAARRWLDQVNRPSGLMAGAEVLDAIVAEVMAVLEDPVFAFLFAPGSRAEVPIVADLPRADGGRDILSGQIDRLVVAESTCHIIDFKSNRPPAMQPEQVSRQYLRQLALYRSAIQGIYPNHTIHCYLLWSALPRLMPIPGHLLESHALGAGLGSGSVPAP
ncbi:DNA helicase/exodeoxyribonuclease V subunit A [Dongia mobilis]|uniref:DNA 3'-5' helicase n=1 Tax=Dongia mobilis TaxID=578943 RepID=A0A4R6WTR7_9PROT|nr:double-strand break repair helicase AddA [Dongia mobilis]TDQ83438.1 DNA helicase/exodeoxyribonuclease V subunit A [Dongia mobilis]